MLGVNNNMPQINFRVTDEQYSALTNQADELGVKSVPELCKQLSINRDGSRLEDRRYYQVLIQFRRLLSQYDLDEETLKKINGELDQLCHI